MPDAGQHRQGLSLIMHCCCPTLLSARTVFNLKAANQDKQAQRKICPRKLQAKTTPTQARSSSAAGTGPAAGSRKLNQAQCKAATLGELDIALAELQQQLQQERQLVAVLQQQVAMHQQEQAQQQHQQPAGPGGQVQQMEQDLHQLNLQCAQKEQQLPPPPQPQQQQVYQPVLQVLQAMHQQPLPVPPGSQQMQLPHQQAPAPSPSGFHSGASQSSAASSPAVCNSYIGGPVPVCPAHGEQHSNSSLSQNLSVRAECAVVSCCEEHNSGLPLMLFHRLATDSFPILTTTSTWHLKASMRPSGLRVACYGTGCETGVWCVGRVQCD